MGTTGRLGVRAGIRLGAAIDVADNKHGTSANIFHGIFLQIGFLISSRISGNAETSTILGRDPRCIFSIAYLENMSKIGLWITFSPYESTNLLQIYE